MPHIGQEIRRLREERELNQAQLAVLVGTGPAAISRIETGRQSPNSTTLDKLAKALSVEVADLFPKVQARIDPGVKELRWVAHELAPGTPVKEALTRLTTGNQSFLGRALYHAIFAPPAGYSGWLENDPASTMTAIKAALLFVEKTDSDVKSVFDLVTNELVERQIEAGREGQRAAEDEGAEGKGKTA